MYYIQHKFHAVNILFNIANRFYVPYFVVLNRKYSSFIFIAACNYIDTKNSVAIFKSLVKHRLHGAAAILDD